jgi:C4-dicarboxylate-specific signal transduction histidine kinase
MTEGADKEQTRAIFDDGLAFFGAVTASVSHELNNVISIIDQTAGLLQDMIAAENQGTPMNIERLSAAVKTVQTQTGRGLSIISRLNRFAHSADESHVEFDAAEVLGNLVELCQRLAGLKYARIEMTSPTEPLKMAGNPFLVQATVFLSIRAALDATERDDTIRVSTGVAGEGTLVRLQCPRQINTAHPDIVALRFISGHMNAQVEVNNDEQPSVVEITFPAGKPAAS